MSIAIAGRREITKLQKGTKWRTCELFFSIWLFLLQKMLNKTVKFLLIKKRSRPAIEVGFFNTIQFTRSIDRVDFLICCQPG